jgi:molybdopterin-guanine dinucleotide biosynthesis protein B/molybdopterin-guanine dinucleotide biosynthesis protein
MLQSVFPRVLIAGDRPDLATSTVPCVPDVYPGSALGGLHGALRAVATPWMFVAPCDLAFPSPVLVRFLLGHKEDCDVVVLRTPGGFEPVFALYHKNCLEPMERMLARGEYRIYDFYHQVRVRYLDADTLPAGWERALRNLNTPEDFCRMAKEEAVTPPVVSVVAKSGTGKTTLLEKLIAELKSRGYRVGAVKHDAHRFDIDHEGKDSWRLTRAGADTMLITSPEKIAMVKKNPGVEPELSATVAAYCGDLDIVLSEGFKHSAMPKIEVHRKEKSSSLLCRGETFDPALIAVASDEPLELDVPVFDINDAAGLADLIIARFLS